MGSLDVRSVESLDSLRGLRSEMARMIVEAVRQPDVHRVLCVPSPRLSTERIADEWRDFERALRPELVRRVGLLVTAEDAPLASLGHVPEEAALRCVQARPLRRGRPLLPPRDLSFVILKLLVYAWATRGRSVPIRWLTGTAGCSYPTVAAALARLGRSVVRESDRSVRLREFPADHWGRALARAEAARSTMRYADRSGRPRGASSLAERLNDLRPDHVAVGGVLGARHHVPDLDVMGLPRLDVSVHSPGRWPDLDFVRRLDPALEATPDPHEPAQLVVHFVRHDDPLFEAGEAAVPWADPVESLLDLHEAGLETQALEFVEALRARREQRP